MLMEFTYWAAPPNNNIIISADSGSSLDRPAYTLPSSLTQATTSYQVKGVIFALILLPMPIYILLLMTISHPYQHSLVQELTSL